MYAIPPQAVVDLLLRSELTPGENTIVADISGCQHPVKIIAIVEPQTVTVVTNSPLARGRQP